VVNSVALLGLVVVVVVVVVVTGEGTPMGAEVDMEVRSR